MISRKGALAPIEDGSILAKTLFKQMDRHWAEEELLREVKCSNIDHLIA
jgi:hypothetical protein